MVFDLGTNHISYQSNYTVYTDEMDKREANDSSDDLNIEDLLFVEKGLRELTSLKVCYLVP